MHKNLRSATLLRLFTFLVFAGVGYVVGIATVSHVGAAIAVEVYVNPGPQSTQAMLLCGWHSDLGCPNNQSTAKALDWPNGYAHRALAKERQTAASRIIPP